MKEIIFITILTLIQASIYAQIDTTKSSYDDFKVLEIYDVSTSYSKIGNKVTYKVDGAIVSKKEYDKYSLGLRAISECKPCYMKHYNKKGVLVKYAAQYTDCRIGVYKEFFKDGKVKIIGHYKENHTGDWSDLYKRGYCSKKHGKWEYFNIYGILYKIEEYENGRLLSSKP